MGKRGYKNIQQYWCSVCSGYFWSLNNICSVCRGNGASQTISNTFGIGWFHCSCGRNFSGFTRGGVTSRCYACQRHIFPKSITPGIRASGKKNKSNNRHSCSVCQGQSNKNCPIVAEAKNRDKIQG